MQLKTLDKYTGLTVTILFLLMIFVPISVMKFTRESSISQVEKRRLAKQPQLHFTLEAIQTYPRQYEDYFNDHFGLRSKFIWLYNSLFVSLLKTSPSLDVIVGKDKWLYYATGFNYQDFTGNRLQSREMLMEWKQRLTERQQWLDKLGIRYLLLPVPYKISVYSEHLPDRMQALAGETGVEQFLSFLRQPPEFTNVLDVKKLFMEAKKTQLLYYQTDTHWNFTGAYITYCAIIKHFQHWFPDMQPYPWEKLIKTIVPFNGNLSNIINIGSLYEEDNLDLEIPDFNQMVSVKNYKIPDAPDNSLQVFRKGRAKIHLNPSQKRSALVITDSFGTALRHYLSMNFGRIIFVQDARFEDLRHLIEKEHPDVVIDINGSVRFVVALGESIALRNESINDIFAGNTPFYRLTNADFPDHTKQITNAEYKNNKKGEIILQSSSNDPQLVFDIPGKFSEKPLYIHCRFTAPADTLFQIFYQNEDSAFYLTDNRLSAKVHKGINDIYFRVYRPIALDNLRIDIGAVPGKYRLDTFELTH